MTTEVNFWMIEARAFFSGSAGMRAGIAAGDWPGVCDQIDELDAIAEHGSTVELRTSARAAADQGRRALTAAIVGAAHG